MSTFKVKLLRGEKGRKEWEIFLISWSRSCFGHTPQLSPFCGVNKTFDTLRLFHYLFFLFSFFLCVFLHMGAYFLPPIFNLLERGCVLFVTRLPLALSLSLLRYDFHLEGLSGEFFFTRILTKLLVQPSKKRRVDISL